MKIASYKIISNKLKEKNLKNNIIATCLFSLAIFLEITAAYIFETKLSDSIIFTISSGIKSVIVYVQNIIPAVKI